MNIEPVAKDVMMIILSFKIPQPLCTSAVDDVVIFITKCIVNIAIEAVSQYTPNLWRDLTFLVVITGKRLTLRLGVHYPLSATSCER